MDSATEVAYVADPRTVTVTDEGQEYDDMWQLKPMDVQHLGEHPETMRQTPMLLIPCPAADQLIYVAGPDRNFPLQDHLDASRPFLLKHDVWVGGSKPAWQRLYLMQVRAIQLHADRLDKNYRFRMILHAADLAYDRHGQLYRKYGRNNYGHEFEDARSTFISFHTYVQNYERHLGIKVTPCPTYDDLIEDLRESDEGQEQEQEQEHYFEDQEQHQPEFGMMQDSPRWRSADQDRDGDSEYVASDQDCEAQEGDYQKYDDQEFQKKTHRDEDGEQYWYEDENYYQDDSSYALR